MEAIKQEFMPKPADLRFFSEAEGIAYARNAGFSIDDGNVIKATRKDIEGYCVLQRDKEDPDKFVWIRKDK